MVHPFISAHVQNLLDKQPETSVVQVLVHTEWNLGKTKTWR